MADNRQSRWWILAWPAGLYAAWLAMMAVHEAGHVLHAWISGGAVDRIEIPLLGFSQTFYSVNPRPHFVAWGGPVWGSVIPLIGLGLLAPGPRIVRRIIQFFAGFCLIANGAYIAVGSVTRAGDAGDLVDLGTPVWALITLGVCAVSAGLYLWHRMDARGAPRSAATESSGTARW